MTICPGCGAGMRFDIATQKLLCDYCGTAMNVEETEEGRNAVDSTDAIPGAQPEDLMEVTVFTCPQCGGEIYTAGSEAQSFCTFCGASVTLEGRLTSTRRPLHIIPFKKTREDCKKIYAGLTRKAVFTPKELKDPEYLERFRGIYLPFWNYNITQKGPVKLKGSRESGNYTEHLKMTADLDITYDGIAYDASSSFDDGLCRAITPFNQSSLKPFHTGYLSGFFADTADVESQVYTTDAKGDANEETLSRLSKKFDASIDMPKDKSEKLNTKIENVTIAMYPVWFLTYRMKDRVAYAVVNGETGKIAADLPVDRRKYLLGSVLLAIPLFFLLTFLPTITATRLLGISVLMALAAFAIFALSTREIKKKELRLDDKGYQARLKDTGQSASDGSRPAQAGKEAAIPENVFVRVCRTYLPLVVSALGILILLIHPVSDLYYYGGTIIILACVCFTLTGLIGRFNLLTTRPLPNLHERGGDLYV